MPVKGDLEYFRNIGSAGMDHALNKPWSDDARGGYLMELGAVMGLLPPGGKLLDLGCGTGWTSYYFARSGYDVVGQDVAPEAVTEASAMAEVKGMDNLRFVLSDYEGLDFHEMFDTAVFFDSLHHSLDEKKAVASAYRALKKGGVLITSEPGYGHEKRSQETIRKYGVTERDMPPARIIAAGREAGFTSFEVYPHAHHLFTALYMQSLSPRMRKLLDLPGARSLAALFTILFYRRRAGIVLLRK